MQPAYTNEIVSAYTFALGALALLGPYLAVSMGHWRRLSAVISTQTRTTAALIWLVLLALGVVLAALASIGLGYAITAYPIKYPLWVAFVLVAILQPLALYAWALLTRPDTDVTWNDMPGLVASLGLSSTATVFLFMLGADGTLANYMPALLYMWMPVQQLAMLVMRILENGHQIIPYYAKLTDEEEELKATGTSTQVLLQGHMVIG